MKDDKIKITKAQFELACASLACSAFSDIENKLNVLYGFNHRNTVVPWSYGPWSPKSIN